MIIWRRNMAKKIFIIFVILVAAYFAYMHFIAPETQKVSEDVEQKVFEGPYSQVKAAKQIEAKQWAQVIINEQNRYFAVNGRYASTLNELGFVPRISQTYRAEAVSADENDFVIRIIGNIDNDSTEDVWEVTKDGFSNRVDDKSY